MKSNGTEMWTEASVEAIEARVRPLRQQVAAHGLYGSVRTVEDVRLFMESHVFAVWDFMSLLKALQRSLTCVELPWAPSAFPVSRRLVNEIVLGEESDEYLGRPLSHLEIYLEAMERVGADTGAIRRTVASAAGGWRGVSFEGAPRAAEEFVASTFRVIREGSAAAQAASFTYGREDAIPEMFRALVQRLDEQGEGELGPLVWYLERHIEVDGEEHGPLAKKMVADLCGDDAALWEEAGRAAEEALRARLRLWDGILEQIEEETPALG